MKRKLAALCSRERLPVDGQRNTAGMHINTKSRTIFSKSRIHAHVLPSLAAGKDKPLPLQYFSKSNAEDVTKRQHKARALQANSNLNSVLRKHSV
jgi:hypothetical protein